MQRTQVVLIGIIVVILILALYVWIAKPTLVLPTVTVPVSEANSIGLIQRQLKIGELNLKMRTDGKILINADGHDLGYAAYTPVSLQNLATILTRVSLTPTQKMGVTVFSYIFQRLVWNVYLTGVSLYYALPVEITFRFIPG